MNRYYYDWSGGFNPSAIAAGSTFWWGSADVGITESGGLVTGITDRSGNGRHGSNTGGTVRPSLVTDAGFPALRFNGIQWLRAATPNCATQYTLAAVIKVDDGAVVNNFAFGVGSVGNSRGAVLGPSAGTTTLRGARHNGQGTREDGTYSLVQYERTIITFTNVGVPKLFVNGVNQNIVTNLGYAAPTTADFVWLGELFGIGSRKFYFREAFWFDRDIGLSNVAILDTYLARWAA